MGKDFNKNGIVYVDCSTLLSNINYAKVVILKTEQKSLDQKLETLKTFVSESKALYAKYDATQTSINTKNSQLESAVSDVYITMDIDTRFDTQKQVAEGLLSSTNVGDKHGYVSIEAKTVLQNSIGKGEIDFASGLVDKLTVLSELESSIKAFNSKKVVVKKKVY